MMAANGQPEKTATNGSSGSIRSVEKVIDILELLARESDGLALGDLSRRLNLNASTAHHLIATLRGRGFIAQDERTKSYRIGYRLVGLVSTFLAGTDLYPAAVGPIEELRDRSGETCYLSVFQGHELATIISLTGSRPVQARRVHRPGVPNLHSTATGKILLGHLAPDELDRLLETNGLASFTPNTITDQEALRAELAAIRAAGHAFDREEDYLGLQCIAAPVYDAGGACVASASVSYPVAPAERTAELVQLVRDAADRVSVNLGAVPAVRQP